MTIQTFDKKYVALTQLETAIRLYLEGEDYFSAITLAGAAEEIFGKLVIKKVKDNSLVSLLAEKFVKKKDLKNSLESLKEAGVEIHKASSDTEIKAQDIAKAANRTRNAMKHLNSTAGPTLTFDPKEEAADMIDRAIENYCLLERLLTPAMEKFTDSIMEA